MTNKTPQEQPQEQEEKAITPLSVTPEEEVTPPVDPDAPLLAGVRVVIGEQIFIEFRSKAVADVFKSIFIHALGHEGAMDTPYELCCSKLHQSIMYARYLRDKDWEFNQDHYRVCEEAVALLQMISAVCGNTESTKSLFTLQSNASIGAILPNV